MELLELEKSAQMGIICDYIANVVDMESYLSKRVSRSATSLLDKIEFLDRKSKLYKQMDVIRDGRNVTHLELQELAYEALRQFEVCYEMTEFVFSAYRHLLVCQFLELNQGDELFSSVLQSYELLLLEEPEELEFTSDLHHWLLEGF